MRENMSTGTGKTRVVFFSTPDFSQCLEIAELDANRFLGN
jgi:hypothetical protein